MRIDTENKSFLKPDKEMRKFTNNLEKKFSLPLNKRRYTEMIKNSKKFLSKKIKNERS